MKFKPEEYKLKDVSMEPFIDVEEIEVVYLNVNDAKEFILDESRAKTPGIMYAMMWWFSMKQERL